MLEKILSKETLNAIDLIAPLAEDEPQPDLLVKGKDWEWVSLKSFFNENIKKFEKRLIL